MIRSFFNITSNQHKAILEFIEVLTAQQFNQRDAQKFIGKINKDYVFEDGDTLLDMCLRKRRFKAASWLVQQKVKITSKNKSNISTLRLAIESGQVVVVDEIVNNYEYNINQVDTNGRSLLQDAVILGHEDIIKILIDKGINPNIIDSHGKNVAFDAVAYGDDKILDKVLNIKGIDLNIKDNTGRTILHQKTTLDNDRLATKLLRYGADPTISDPDGYSFLTHVALRGEKGKELLDTAIKYGCNINAKSPSSHTVLMEVVKAFTNTSRIELERRSELKDVAQELVDRGSDLEIVNQYGETILFKTVRTNDYEGCAFLIKNGAKVNVTNNAQETPLMLAFLQGNKALDIISLLLDEDADPFIPNRYNQTIPEFLGNIILHLYDFKPFEHQEYLPFIDPDGHYLLVLKHLLAQRHFDFTRLDSSGNPYFFTPFLLGELNIIKLYLNYKIDINLKNSHGHNLFYEYVLQSFEQQIDIFSFKEKLTFLLVNGSDITVKNTHGQNIFSKVASTANCDLKLFRKLSELTKHDYFSQDSLGRTIIHACVFSNNVELFSLVYGVQRDIQHIPDDYNMLPITYAALLGRKEIVIELLRRDTKINSAKPIPQGVKKKFQPMLKSLSKLQEGIEDPILLRQIQILCDQVRKDLV